MPEIQTLNKLERKLISFGVIPQPRQTARGSICLPVKYVGAGFGAVLSCVGGQPTERWWGQCSPTVQHRIREHSNSRLMPIHIYWGEDEFLISRAIKQLRSRILDKQWASFNYSEYPPDSKDSIPQAIADVMTPP